MILKLKVKQVSSLGQNMIRLILTRPHLRNRIEPLPKTEEQKVRQDLAKQAKQILDDVVPTSVIVRKPAGTISKQEGLIVDMQITEDEYDQMGRPGVNDTAQLDINTQKEKLKLNHRE